MCATRKVQTQKAFYLLELSHKPMASGVSPPPSLGHEHHPASEQRSSCDGDGDGDGAARMLVVGTVDTREGEAPALPGMEAEVEVEADADAGVGAALAAGMRDGYLAECSHIVPLSAHLVRLSHGTYRYHRRAGRRYRYLASPRLASFQNWVDANVFVLLLC